MVSSVDPVSRERVHVDGRERDVMQDVDAVDLVDLSDTVLKFKGGCVVDDHLELSEGAEDLHLKVMSRHERKRPQKLPLLFPPAFPQFMIADQNRFSSFVESRVDMKGDIVTAQEVDREHFSIWFNLSSDS